ncbi:MAG: hypothetical protein SCM96_07635 [Acidobacteriota bacterium]|nr:hypothetical protein [Acidobacteriota bacterium]
MRHPRLNILLGVSLTSAAVLGFQLAMTRYYAVSQDYHFAFLVISLSFLGFGAAGSFLVLARNHLEKRGEAFPAATSFLFGLTLLGSTLAVNHFPFDFQELLWNEKKAFFIVLEYLILCLPFFFAGLTLSSSLTLFSSSPHKIYFFDLLGAGLGVLGGLFLFALNEDRGVFPTLAFIAFCATPAFALRRSRRTAVFLLLLPAGAAVLAAAAPDFLAFRMAPFKPLAAALKYPNAELVLTRWNALARVDVIDSPAVRFAPGLSLIHEEDLPPQLGLILDGEAMTAVTAVSGDNAGSDTFLSRLPSSWPYLVRRRPHVLIIEPGGGLDVLAARRFQASSITAVVENPLVAEILRRDLSEWTGGLFSHDHVRMEVSGARTFLRRADRTFDLIVLPMTDAGGAMGTGLLGLGEDFLITVESFMDILACLDEDGLVSITFYLLPPLRQEFKILATWIEALEKTGRRPDEHLAVMRTWGTLSLFVGKSPFSAEETTGLREFAERLVFDVDHPPASPEDGGMNSSFSGFPYSEFVAELLDPQRRGDFFKDYLFDVRPASDNRPFFKNFFKWSRTAETLEAFGGRWLPLLQGQYIVPLILIQSLLWAFLFILLPLRPMNRSFSPPRGLLVRTLFYFSCIGAGFIFIEMTLIHTFILFLGRPLYAFAAVLSAVLISAGIGSLAGLRILGRNPAFRLRVCLALLGGAAIAYQAILPVLIDRCIGFSLGARLGLTFAAVLPLGFAMGMPFPGALRMLHIREKRLIPLAWATNAFASVAGSSLALLAAFSMGYGAVLALGGGLYLAALLFLGFADHGNKADIQHLADPGPAVHFGDHGQRLKV